jgi:hypothetical protein
MRFAAKRTWPDRPKAWEHQGEAESLEAFALAFATERGLGVGTEFVVLGKDSDDADLESFRVTAVDPHTLGPVGAHPEGESAPGRPAAWVPEGQAAVTEYEAPSEPPLAGAAFSFMSYMVKVVLIILGVSATLMFLMKHFNLTGPA